MKQHFIIEHDEGGFYPNELFLKSLDGRVAFSVVFVDGNTIEISAVDVTKIDDVLYNNRLIIEPVVSNTIRISRPKYR